MALTTRQEAQKLRHYLRNLPDFLPVLASQKNDFHYFVPNEDWITDTSLEGAVNRGLEIALGSRAQGVLSFKERGPGMEALADVLERYLMECPGSVLLKKWLSDAITAAETVFVSAGLDVRAIQLLVIMENAHCIIQSYPLCPQ